MRRFPSISSKKSAKSPGMSMASAGIDMCRVRKSGLGMWVDIHVEVPGDMTVRDGHQISHLVKDALLASGHNVMDVVVHIEPAKEFAGRS